MIRVLVYYPPNCCLTYRLLSRSSSSLYLEKPPPSPTPCAPRGLTRCPCTSTTALPTGRDGTERTPVGPAFPPDL